MHIKNKHLCRGDTLVEVLIATAVFSLVAVGSLMIMNQGSATAQRALEITLVRQEIDAQAEALRYLNAKFISQPYTIDCSSPTLDDWGKIDCHASTILVVSNFEGGVACSVPTNAFILNARKALFMSPSGIYRPVPARTFSQLIYNSSNNLETNTANLLGGTGPAQGIWIEAKKISSPNHAENNAIYIDFHIRACWDSPGQSVPVTMGTIVRLYAPNI